MRRSALALANPRVHVLAVQISGEERSGRREAEPEFGHGRDLDDAVVQQEVEGVSASGVLVVEEVQVVPGDGDALLVVGRPEADEDTVRAREGPLGFGGGGFRQRRVGGFLSRRGPAGNRGEVPVTLIP